MCSTLVGISSPNLKVSQNDHQKVTFEAIFVSLGNWPQWLSQSHSWEWTRSSTTVCSRDQTVTFHNKKVFTFFVPTQSIDRSESKFLFVVSRNFWQEENQIFLFMEVLPISLLSCYPFFHVLSFMTLYFCPTGCLKKLWIAFSVSRLLEVLERFPKKGNHENLIPSHLQPTAAAECPAHHMSGPQAPSW